MNNNQGKRYNNYSNIKLLALFIILSASLLLYGVITQTQQLSPLLLKIANNWLENRGSLNIDWQINSSVSDEIFTVSNIKLFEKDSANTSFVELDIVSIDFSFIDYFFRDKIDSISISGGHFNLNQSKLLRQLMSNNIEENKTSLSIHSIELNDFIIANKGEKRDIYVAKIPANYKNNAGNWVLEISDASIFIPLVETLNTSMSGEIFGNNDRIEISDFVFTTNDGRVKINAHKEKLSIWEGDFLFSDLNIESYLGKISPLIDWDYINPNGRFFFEIDDKGKFALTGAGSNPGKTGNYKLNIDDFTLLNGHISSIGSIINNNETIDINIDYAIDEKYLRIHSNISEFDLTPFINSHDFKLSNLTGELSIIGKVDSLFIESYFSKFAFQQLSENKFSSRLLFIDGRELVIQNIDWVNAKDTLSILGIYAINDVDINGSARIQNISKYFVHDSLNNISGNLKTDFNISNGSGKIEIVGDIKADDLRMNTKLSASGIGNYYLKESLNDWDGFFEFEAKRGFFWDDSLNLVHFLIRKDKTNYTVEKCLFKSPKNGFELQGKLSSTQLELNKFDFWLHDEHVFLSTLKIIPIIDNKLIISDTLSLNMDQGQYNITGAIDFNKGYQLEALLYNIDAENIQQLLKFPFPMSGNINGSFNIIDSITNPKFVGDLFWDEFKFMQFKADSLIYLGTTHSHVTDIKNILYYADDGQLLIQGQFPFGYRIPHVIDPNRPQDLRLTMNNMMLKNISFREIGPIGITGKLDGGLLYKGSPIHSKMTGIVSITNGTIDTLHYKKANLQLAYENDILNIDTTSIIADWMQGGGSGYIPARLDVMPGIRPYLAKDTLDFSFQGKFSSLKFLSSYIGIIDKIDGDFEGKGRIFGPMESPIRAFRMRGQNGVILSPLLGNPVTNIVSDLEMLDNTLSIKLLKGNLDFIPGGELETKGLINRATGFVGKFLGINNTTQYNSIVEVKGSADFTSFFHPHFNINIKGDDVYYRSTDGELEAIADAAMHISGQDTIIIKGEIAVLNSILLSEFSSNDEIILPSISDDFQLRYNLATTFPGNIRIKNTMIDAEFSGELWLLDYGDEILRFSGTLEAVPGGKFYYLLNENELTIKSGSISFDPVEFNPQIDILVEIIIDSEIIELGFTGDLKEPEIIFPDNATFNQTDILSWLNLKQKIDTEGINQDKLVSAPLEWYLGTLIEKQTESFGRQVTGLDIFDLKMDQSRNLFENIADDTSAVSIVLGHRLSNKLKVTYEGDIKTTDNNSEHVVNMEYQINNNNSVSAGVDQAGLFKLRWRLKYNY